MSREEVMNDLHEPQPENYELEEFINEIRKYYKTHDFKRSVMDDLISRQQAIDALRKDPMGGLNYEGILKRLPSVQSEVIRCKDCKHKPIGTNRDSYEFPDDRCPCKCEDYWYSWNPDDNWFCGNAERKEDESSR